MDAIDEKIIKILNDNGRATASEISKNVKLSIPAVAERIKKLEESNIIEKYTVKLNREALNYKALAFIFVNIDKSENIEAFRNAIIKNNSVLECHHIAGQYDYLLKVLVKDIPSLETFISEYLKGIKGVINTSTIISLSSLKETLNV